MNNAGVGLKGNFLTNELGHELSMLNLNCRAPVVLTHHFGNSMRERGRGGIIFLTSIVAMAGIPVWSHYAATKAHNLLLAEGLAEELHRSGLDVLAVSPGFTRTEFMELTSFGRVLSLEPEKVVRAALTSLGKKRIVTPGLVNKMISFSTRRQPRLANTKIFRAVIRRVQRA